MSGCSQSTNVIQGILNTSGVKDALAGLGWQPDRWTIQKPQ